MAASDASTLTPLFTLLRDAGGFRVFVESGTGTGDIATVAGDVFDTVITMDADKARYDAAYEKLSGRKGILPLHGAAAELIPNLIPRLVGPAVFWLNVPIDDLGPIVTARKEHLICLPGGSASAPEVQVALTQGTPREADERSGVLFLVPRSHEPLLQALFARIGPLQ